MRNRLGAFVCALMALVLLVGGCATPSVPTAAPAPAGQPTGAPAVTAEAAQPTAAVTETVKRGGTLQFARTGDSTTMDPHFADENEDIWPLLNMYDQLLRLGPDGETVVPWAADSWEISDDAMVFTFHLHSGITFWDGAAVKASDWVFSLDRARDPEAGAPYQFMLDPIDKVEAVGDNTLKVTLKEPNVGMLASFTMFNASVLPEEKFKEMGADAFFQHPIGTGAFMFDEWKKGEYLHMVRNPNYWRMGTDGQPLPYLDDVYMYVVPDDNTRILQVQSGTLDAMDMVPFSRITDLKSDPNVDVLLFPSTRTDYWYFNMRVKPLDEANVRKALYYAIDRKALVDAVLFGYGTEACSYMAADSMYWQPSCYDYDLDKAKELLAQSSVPDGFKVTVLITAGSATDKVVAQAIQGMWAKIGVDLQIEEAEIGLLNDRHYDDPADFEICVGQYTYDTPDPSEITADVADSGYDECLNSGCSDPARDALIAQTKTELDPVKRAALFADIQRMWMDELPAMPLYHSPYRWITRKYVKDLVQSPIGSYVFQDTWLDQ